MLNDNNDPGIHVPMTPSNETHGSAALVLVESLIHGLLKNARISLADAVDIVDTAMSVQFEVAEAADGQGAAMWRSHALLASIGRTLRISDIGDPGLLRPIP